MGFSAERVLRSMGWLLLLLVCGCPAAPNEVELTVALGAEQVEVQATLRDVQVWTRDPAEALLAFHEVHAPEMPSVARMLHTFAWMPQLQRWEWRVREGALDLFLVGSMSRARFETCLEMPLEERKRGGEKGSACEGFPLWRSGTEYRAIPEVELDMASKREVVMLGATHWPLQAQRLETRFRPGAQWLTYSRGSALPSFEQEERSSEAVSAYVSLVGRQREAFRQGDTAKCKALQTEAEQALPVQLRALFAHQRRRERLWLLEALLSRHGLAVVKPLPQPLDSLLSSLKGTDYAAALIPRQRPSELLLLRLARLHDQAAVRFGVNWETGSEDFSASLDETELQQLCGELRRKAPEWKRPCAHLMETRP